LHPGFFPGAQPGPVSVASCSLPANSGVSDTYKLRLPAIVFFPRKQWINGAFSGGEELNGSSAWGMLHGGEGASREEREARRPGLKKPGGFRAGSRTPEVRKRLLISIQISRLRGFA
jgi:hypothetical protein